MKFFYKLEYKFGRYAIPGLMTYFTVLYAIGFALSFMRPGFYYENLSLNFEAILSGQIWRLVSWLMYPPSTSLFWGLLALLVYYSLGTALERTWGKFRFNVFMFMGVILHILAAAILYAITGYAFELTPGNLNLSIFLAFAVTYPEVRFYIYFVIPVKAKWLGILYGVTALLGFIVGGITTKITIFLCLFNFLVFFLVTRDWTRVKLKVSPAQKKRRADFQSQVKVRPMNTHHKCAVCGRTELDGDDMVFRFCSKCKGNYEYCQDHLYTHVHIDEDGKPLSQ